MIHKDVLRFLNNLKENNDRSWFEAHRSDYENAKEKFAVTVEELIKGMAKIEPATGNFTAKDCIFRINRDVRFSKDKSPYKTNMAAYFNRDGKKGLGAGYYVHIEPGKAFAGAGIWMPEPAVLQNIRQEIDYNFARFKKITGNASLKKHFPNGLEQSAKLTRAPKNYEEDNPAIEFLKLKSFILSKPYIDAQLQSRDFTKNLLASFKAAKPFIDFLNESLA